MKAVVGIDVGTSSTKALLVSLDGEILAQGMRDHTVDRPGRGLVEMDGDVWWAECCALVPELLAAEPTAEIVSVGVSGMGPCVLLSGDDGRPLRPAVLYGVDTRAADLIDEITESLGGVDAMRARTGSALSTQAAGLKLAWLARHEPEIWARASRFTMPSSRLVELLTDEYVLDHHSASHCTPLYDVHRLAWIDEWVERLAPGLEMPRLAWSGDRAGVVTERAAAATGLPAGIPVTVGAIDAFAEGLSVGLDDPERMFLQYGTTMFMLVPLAEPRPVPGLWTTVGDGPGRFSAAGGLATAGAITDWLRQLTGADWADILDEAADSGVGARGLLVLPYFAGERTPLGDPEARGVIAGLTVRHTRGDIYRAVLEATAFAVRHHVEVLAEAGIPVRSLVGAGGGVLSHLWPQIVSDVCGLPQVVPWVSVGASFGSALLAAGLVTEVDIDLWNPPAIVLTPDESARAAYDEAYRDYRRLYPDTLEVVHRLAARG